MREHDLILYDLDGTLWDSIPVILDSFRHSYIEVFGRCDRTDEDFMTYIGRPLAETFEMHEKEQAKALLDAYLTYNHKLLELDSIRMFPGIMNDLNYIKSKGISQGIVTSKAIYAAMTTLKIKDLDDFFDVYVCREHTVLHKPEAEPLLYAAGKLGIHDMSRVIYVGDALPDAQCAANAGADFALVSWSQMDKEDIMRHAPDGKVIIDSLRELVD